MNIENETFNSRRMRIADKRYDIEAILCYFCLIDVLFFPYFRKLSIPTSLIVVLCWYLFRVNLLIRKREFLLFVVFQLLSSLGLIISIILYPEGVAKNSGEEISLASKNFTLYAIMSIFFLYFFMFYSVFERKNIDLTLILKFYFLFCLILVGIYYFSFDVYFDVRSFWSMSGQEIQHDKFSSMVRYTGIISDPNNASLAFLSIVSFLLLFEHKPNGRWQLLLISGLLIMMVACMSKAGFIGGVLVTIISGKYLYNAGVRSIVSYYIVASLLFLLLIFFYPYFLDFSVLDTSIERVSDFGKESRFEIWVGLLHSDELLKRLFFGTGPVIITGGEIVKPHNGHLYIYYSCGFVAYLIFMWLVFRYRRILGFRRYIFVVPLLLAFSVNVGLYDFRYSMIMSALIAYYAAVARKSYREIR